MDRLTTLAAFVRTAEAGSQSAAARGLGLTPAMVGRHIRALEDRLGTRLLNRTTARQSLTEAGAAFLPRAAAILEELQAAEDAVADRPEIPRGTVRVAAPMVFGTMYLAAQLAEFAQRHPSVRLHVTLNDRPVDLVEEGFDVALRIGRLAPSSLIARQLAPCRMVLAAAPSYLARRGTPLVPADLGGHDCLLYDYFSSGAAWRFTGPDGRAVEQEVAGSLLANNGAALAAAAVAGAGIVLQPRFILADPLRAGALVPLLPGWTHEDLAIAAVFPSARHLAPKIRAFVDFLAAWLRPPLPWD